MKPVSSQPVVAIGIPTYKRQDGLELLLQSISKIESLYPIHIIIADNEGNNGPGFSTAHRLKKKGYPFPITVLPVQTRGVSSARNALLHQAFEVYGVEYLAMVDDDEQVDKNWINELVATQKDTGADIIGGRVIPKFSPVMPKWASQLEIYYNTPPLKDGPTEMIWGAGNSLLYKTTYALSSPVLFDLRFSKAGGEDDEYFCRQKKQGMNFAFNPNAITYEYFSGDRLTKKWALERSFRIGSSYISIIKLHAASDLPIKKKILLWGAEMTKLLLGMGQGIFTYVAYCFNPSRQMVGACLVARQIGKVRAIVKNGDF